MRAQETSYRGKGRALGAWEKESKDIHAWRGGAGERLGHASERVLELETEGNGERRGMC